MYILIDCKDTIEKAKYMQEETALIQKQSVKLEDCMSELAMCYKGAASSKYITKMTKIKSKMEKHNHNVDVIAKQIENNATNILAVEQRAVEKIQSRL